MPKVLLVDDDDDLSETLQAWFVMEGHDVETAQNGQEALDKLEAQPYDIVILDWQLPQVEGVEVCRRYRASGGSGKILMLTGMRDAESLEEGRKAGCDQFLTKPFTLDQLMEKFSGILES